MYYLEVRWFHTFQDEPVLIYSELDEDLWELRKVEEFPDGTLGYADNKNHTEFTELSISRYPPFDEIASHPEFELNYIDQEIFEKVWIKSHA
tara:strand:+ start:366 stop:641 length:276 start_codon:yes stop_codon:yes gene_type:complete